MTRKDLRLLAKGLAPILKRYEERISQLEKQLDDARAMEVLVASFQERSKQ